MAFALRSKTFRPAALAAVVLLLLGGAHLAAEPRVHPFWGNEALWGYWEFETEYVPKKDWKIVSVSQESAGDQWKSPNLIDGDPQTYYYPSGKDFYEVTIDLGKSYGLGAFTILTLGRPNNANDSLMASYEFFVSESADAKGEPVAKGPFEGDVGKETVVTFPPAKGRFVTLKAFARPNANKEVCLRELSLVEASAAKAHLEMKQAEAKEKQARWQDRDSDAARLALGKDLLDMLFVMPEEINKSNLRNRERLVEMGKMKAAGKFAEALKAFRDYYFDKLRRPQQFGLHANDVNPWGRGFANVGGFPAGVFDSNQDTANLAKQITAADDLVKGDMTIGKEKVHIGEPGSVDWMAPGPPYGHTTKAHTQEPYRDLWWGTGFYPLYTAWMVTKDDKYLKRWVAYMDDWALNSTFLLELHPIFNHDNSAYPVVTTVKMLAGIANDLAFESEGVPPAAFARIMKKLVTESVLNDVVYMRSNPNAWTPGAGRMLFAEMIDEFKAAPIYFRETRRRNIEDVNVVQGLLDGTEDHQWPGYNWLLLINAGALKLIDTREMMPPWALPSWEKEIHTQSWRRELEDFLGRRAAYQIHWVTPAGEYPLTTHHEPPSEKGKMREGYTVFPDALKDPTSAKIVATLYGEGLNPVPDWTDEWFPYGGYSIARTGWTREDSYGSMFCSPQPGLGSVGSACKNNAFSLAAFGMDLLEDDVIHSYVRPTSPIQVDKKRQAFDFNVYVTSWPSGHKGQMVSAWTEPSPWRWHSSDSFNLMEGVYAGPYANNNRDRKDFLDDVSHQRLALFARKAGLWILTDRLTTPKKHDYEQIWWLPLKKKEFGGFKPEEIVTDDASKNVKTRRTGTDKYWSWDALRNIVIPNANLSMYQFTDAALKYDSKTLKSSEEMYDFQRIGVTWTGEGPQQIVTALYPRRPIGDKAGADGTENDLVSVKSVSVCAPKSAGAGGQQDPDAGQFTSGCELVTPDGWRVTYLARVRPSHRFVLDGFDVLAEALLLVQTADSKGDVQGVVLGCTEMKVGGKAVAVKHPDFEFSIPASKGESELKVAPGAGGGDSLPVSRDVSKMKTDLIYRPISPVKILPESDVFADSEEVTLKSATPGVIIHYTLDESDPTPQSPLYEKPFKIDRSAIVKARAYRPGVEKNVPTTSGTHMTAMTFAVYTKKYAYPPADVQPNAHGLNFEYYESFWKDMWLALDRCEVKKKGTVDGLFDLSPVPADNKPVGDKLSPREKPYAVKYAGYLQVPADGVYTIHAPREYVYCDTVSGYELQVWLGHAMYNDAGTPRREGDMSYWYPATRLHGLGTWSAPLKKGFHEFKVVWIDFRMDGPKRLNREKDIREYVWSGEKPALMISGPNLEKQPIPAAWLWR
jgi:hypothetical protein